MCRKVQVGSHRPIKCAGRFRWAATGLLPLRPAFSLTSVRVGFMADEVALGQRFVGELFSPASIIPPALHVRSFAYHWRCVIQGGAEPTDAFRI